MLVLAILQIYSKNLNMHDKPNYKEVISAKVKRIEVLQSKYGKTRRQRRIKQRLHKYDLKYQTLQ